MRLSRPCGVFIALRSPTPGFHRGWKGSHLLKVLLQWAPVAAGTVVVPLLVVPAPVHHVVVTTMWCVDGAMEPHTRAVCIALQSPTPVQCASRYRAPHLGLTELEAFSPAGSAAVVGPRSRRHCCGASAGGTRPRSSCGCCHGCCGGCCCCCPCAVRLLPPSWGPSWRPAVVRLRPRWLRYRCRCGPW